MAAMARRNDSARPPRSQPLKPAARLEKIEAFRAGISAESRAAAWLIPHCYRILARRWKSPLGEIDIIAARRIWPASTFTSPATTAKPRPASPAHAASMVALSASRLVYSAIPGMSLTTSPMRPAASSSSLTAILVQPALFTALMAMALYCAT
jgi:hypothetical protein